ncbi:hypothetical protein PTSG_11988 [Salpingoeca rosetta]|uniref:Intraflagellar transport protein 122 homolog n=1 Tax=Salpingoeca rosetta (strain ATCC 50818 / BSB-021) TaxID=946362 RepID=F2U4R0_SALR5|nr:uncharacterized protein PTSG_11988 [Salpingoeca rosetta]EGD82626.1 hypothetical protein PTSG_11988 [Salpingoeca rosetta]|eukprot:XP_004995862.1 hypothetical protein PTSG_11988 [Salpingoeca rosetta]
MRSMPVWVDTVHNQQGERQSIYSLAFRPDGTQLIAGAGARVLVYEVADGQVIASLKGHKDVVYCVAFSNDGTLFASGAADKTVIVWDGRTLSGQLKYSHNDTIQALAFNPLNNILASCSSSDFGFWSKDITTVEKTRVSSRICAASWTNDGQYIALGHFNGNVSIRNQRGEEKVLIDRQGRGPVWSLQWNPSKNEKTDTLAVCDCNQRLSFYLLSGRQIGKERVLDYDPCSLSYFSDGNYLVMGGSNRKAGLYTRDGIHLGDICEQEGWVWSCAARPGQNYVAVGCQDGTIALHHLVFSTVHGLYRERYAFRRNMTNVVVQDLSAGTESRVPCRELVKKIAIFKNRLAVQLPKQINVYEMEAMDSGKLKFRLMCKLRRNFECNLLVVCSKHIILCQERRLQSWTFDNQKEREWSTDSMIRYIKVIGGPDGREGLLVGQKNGTILQIFVDNPFPIELIKQATPVRCLDLSSQRTKLAVVNDHGTCLVYDLATKDLLYQEPHANSVAWNTQNEDMLCYSGNGMLHIKAANFPLHVQKLQGFVVGFSGSRIYCLHVHSMKPVDVPQSHSMHQYLKKGEYDGAYRVALTRSVPMEALEGLNFEVAKQSFIRVRDIRYLDLIHRIQERERMGMGDDPDVYRAQIYAYQGRFEEAAKLYARAGQPRLAMEMYCDLRQFDRAKKYVDSSNAEDVQAFMKKQAEWSKTANDPLLAIDILNAAGEEIASINMMGENGMVQKLIDKARATNSAETEVLNRIVYWLQKLDQISLAAEVCEKMNDNRKLVELYVSAKRWEDAFALANRLNEFQEDIYHPYADWLAENDRFDEAQEAYRLAGLEDKAVQVLEVLAHNAVIERRFNDAGFYFWKLADYKLKAIKSAAGDEGFDLANQDEEIKTYETFEHRADLYQAYHAISRYIEEPFTSHSTDNLLSICNFLLNAISSEVPFGMSKFNVLFATAKLGRQLGAFKLARNAIEKMRTLRVPATFREHVNVQAVAIRCKPFEDGEDLQPVCYRCSLPNNLWAGSLSCSNCVHPFVLSKYSFDVLPLVEFSPDVDISDAEALQLIQDDSTLGSKRGSGSTVTSGGAQVMSMDDDEDEEEDPFVQSLARFESGSSSYEIVRVDREMLKKMPSNEVFVQRWGAPLQHRYYRNVLADIEVTMCSSCFNFFGTDEWERVTLESGKCPLCRASTDVDEESEAPAAAASGSKVLLGSQPASSSA